MLLEITRKVVITEQWTKNLLNLVFSYEYTKKIIIKIGEKISELRPTEIRPSDLPWPGGGVLQWRSMQILLVILLAQWFSEKPKLILLRLNKSKKSPHNLPWFLKAV